MLKYISFLIVGLIVGAVGGAMFQQSLPPETPIEKQLANLQKRYDDAQLTITELSNQDDIARRSPRDETAERAKAILNRIRNGETVSLDEFYHAYQPFLRDTAPLFGIMRNLAEVERFDSRLGKYTRKYDLSEDEQERLRQWMERKSRRNRREFNAVLESPNATIFDFLKALDDQDRLETGIEDPLRDILSAEEYAQFYEERMNERAERVQRDADGRLNRLEQYVELRPEQQDELFVVFAQNSRFYSPDMQIEGVGDADTWGSPEPFSYDQIYEVLDTDQADQVRLAQERERAEANRRLEAVVLEVGADWDMLDLNPYNGF